MATGISRILNKLKTFTSKSSLCCHFVWSRISLLILWLLFAGAVIYNVQNQDWLKPHRLVKDDVQNYYIYTVAAVVYHNYRLEEVYAKLPSDIKTNLWISRHEENNRYYSKMSMGMAMVYAPFTAFAHYALVPFMNYPADGYSPPYRIGLLLSALCFFLFGLWQLRKVLLKYFSEPVVALTLIVVAFGTNITWYISSEATMSHVYNFALVLYLYRLIERWIAKPTFGLTVLTGLVFGLIVLIRPTNIMFIVLFFTGGAFVERITFLLKNYAGLLLMMAAFLLVWAPQLLFWKWVSGNWFFYTYNEEGFFWNNPQIISSLFSYRKGWLLYTPLMALLFAGLPFLWIKYRGLFWQVITVFILATYINSSWWCWWFGGSFGNRSYIDAYGIYALAIAALFQAVGSLRKTWLNLAGTLIVAAFVCLNLFQTWQYRMGIIHYVSETKKTFWMNFLKTKHQPGYYENLVFPDHKLGVAGIYYFPTEKTDPEKQLIRKKIEKNREYLITYYKTIAESNPELRQQILGGRKPLDEDPFFTKWAEDQYEQLKKRY
ncbi:MAG: hypothetical protein K0B15_08375 [Lentimicrobium sp.]|nr:hypothetical protein [Lentimicrobium sp.]